MGKSCLFPDAFNPLFSQDHDDIRSEGLPVGLLLSAKSLRGLHDPHDSSMICIVTGGGTFSSYLVFSPFGERGIKSETFAEEV